MAFFNDLVRVIAAAEGMDEMTVAGIGQYAREAGYITKGGRGRSAARMTARDASALLIAVNGAGPAKDAAAAVAAFSDLSCTIDNLKGGPFAELAEMKFGEAFEHLVASHVPGADTVRPFDVALTSLIDGKPSDPKDLNRQVDVEIAFIRPNQKAVFSITTAGPPSLNDVLPNFNVQPGDKAFAFYDQDFAAPRIRSGRRDITVLRGRVLAAVGDVLAT